MSRNLIFGLLVSLILGVSTLTSGFAAPVTPVIGPTDPANCLGQDRAGFARNGVPLLGLEGGSDVALHLVKPLAQGTGFGSEIQAHRAGIPPISTCE